MQTEIQRDGVQLQVKVEGSVDRYGTEALRTAIQPWMGEDFQKMILDFQGVDFIGSSGLALLAELSRRLDSHGRKLSLVHLSPEIQEIFQVLELNRLFL